jgi:hypothetical protein
MVPFWVGQLIHRILTICFFSEIEFLNFHLVKEVIKNVNVHVLKICESSATCSAHPSAAVHQGVLGISKIFGHVHKRCNMFEVRSQLCSFRDIYYFVAP